MKDRVELDKFGLDELVIAGCDLHIERMDSNYIWIGIDRGGKSLVTLSLHAKGAIRVVDIEDSLKSIGKE